MNRKAYKFLLDWKTRKGRKPLVVRGARQVGKTYLVNQFGRAEFSHCLAVNVDRDREFFKRVVSEKPGRLIQLLELEYGCRILPGSSLLFFDEIQAVPEIFARLRYIYEEIPDLHVVAAGSLLDFVLESHSFSMPVGRIEYLHLGPLSFSEFLAATGNPQWVEFLEKFRYREQVPASTHVALLRLFRTFVAVGGMPEAVARYAETGSMVESDRSKESILGTLRDDFTKYGHRVNHDRLLQVFARLPAMTGQKFKYANVSRDSSSRAIESCLRLLELARLIYRVRRSSCSGVPLGASTSENWFKVVFLDVGLMLHACGSRAVDVEREPDLMMVNAGAVAEQAVGQHLLYSRAPWEAPELYCWAREKPTSSSEVDYVISRGARIVPVEVKAGKSGRLRSLWQFVVEKRTPLALRFNADIPSLMDTSNTMDDGSRISYRLLSLPLYMVEHAGRLLDDALDGR